MFKAILKIFYILCYSISHYKLIIVRIQVKNSATGPWQAAVVVKINEDWSVSVKFDESEKAVSISINCIKVKTKNGWEKLSRLLAWPHDAMVNIRSNLQIFMVFHFLNN